jgi:hypothetical protein
MPNVKLPRLVRNYGTNSQPKAGILVVLVYYLLIEKCNCPLVRALLDDKLHYSASKYTKTTKIPAFGRELLLVVFRSNYLLFLKYE